MRDHAALDTARQKLADAVRNFQAPPFYALNVSPYVAMSLMQKAIRRGQKQSALCAAARLLQVAPEKLWRRLGCVSFEDVGVGDFETLSLTMAALTGKRFRESIGGEWPAAAYVVCRLARAAKCRAADDLLMISDAHPKLTGTRAEFATRSTDDLVEVATGQDRLPVRALAARYVVGTNRWRGASLVPRQGEPAALFDALQPTEAVAIAREGWRKLGEVLCPLVAMLMPLRVSGPATTTDDDLPPEVYIGDLPGWALDQYSREGRRVLEKFIEGQTQTARWVRAHIPPRQRLAFIGGIVFRCEGGLLRCRLRWSVADELRHAYEVKCAGPNCSDATEIMEMMRCDIPALNGVRAQVTGV